MRSPSGHSRLSEQTYFLQNAEPAATSFPQFVELDPQCILGDHDAVRRPAKIPVTLNAPVLSQRKQIRIVVASVLRAAKVRAYFQTIQHVPAFVGQVDIAVLFPLGEAPFLQQAVDDRVAIAAAGFCSYAPSSTFACTGLSV